MPAGGSNQRKRHRGGVWARAPARAYTLPCVPHPWRTWERFLNVSDCFLLDFDTCSGDAAGDSQGGAFARSLNCGMPATGRHSHCRFAALCNTLASASFGPFLAETRKGRRIPPRDKLKFETERGLMKVRKKFKFAGKQWEFVIHACREAKRLPYDIHGRSYGFAGEWCRYARVCRTPHPSRHSP